MIRVCICMHLHTDKDKEKEKEKEIDIEKAIESVKERFAFTPKTVESVENVEKRNKINFKKVLTYFKNVI